MESGGGQIILAAKTAPTSLLRSKDRCCQRLGKWRGGLEGPQADIWSMWGAEWYGLLESA